MWIKLTVTCTKCKHILILRELTGELNSEIGTSYVMLSFLGNLDTNFTHIGISRSGFGNSSILSGRPYGGCAFFVAVGFVHTGASLGH